MSQSNSLLKFQVSCDAGGCFGPALPPMMTEEIGEVGFLSDTRYLLLKLVQPTLYQNDQLEYLLVAPRYTGTSLEELRTHRCVVGIARVLPHVAVDLLKGLKKEEVDYFAIGDCEPIVI